MHFNFDRTWIRYILVHFRQVAIIATLRRASIPCDNSKLLFVIETADPELVAVLALTPNALPFIELVLLDVFVSGSICIQSFVYIFRGYCSLFPRLLCFR